MRLARNSSDRCLSVETVAAPPIDVGPFTVTPVARSVALRWRKGAAAWEWPYAVVVSEGGRTSRFRIVDVTRLAQVVIVVVATLCVCGLMSRSAGRRKGSL